MQESWTFDFPNTDFPENELKAILIEKEKDLGIFLSYYFKKDGAVSEKVKLKSSPHFSSATAGKLTLDFDLVHFNACLAIHEKARDEMEMTFEIDQINQKIKLIGAYWPSREMDEI
ncbi:hypothetical protein [Algoriphagus sp.]|jgi:hypothetical protein|uniref:hypothetical protein n=1 Tax=Algoriphagus sp. TaxID=1872435 RepID=UPI0027189B65|nr:hypothetical protein [Algoriphagus sp.]MDO8965760.1 hypothetical protein [Algoriphagus sp.]MDP3198855.1 hypothetical protein [Algoriphagus sp.]